MSSKKANSGFNPSKTDLENLTVSGSGIITINGWETGYLGNAEYIPLLPSDLIINTADNTGLNNQQVAPEIGHYARSGSSKAFGFLPPNGYVGQKIIPRGFRVTAAAMSGSGTSSGWRIGTGSIDNNTAGLIAGTVPSPLAINTTHVFSTPIEGDGLMYISFNFEPTSASDAFFGGQLFMEKI
tara:strand:- start:4376 stop:4924 length:549 start_codon:yes stop_codon:yes gene_type:complete